MKKINMIFIIFIVMFIIITLSIVLLIRKSNTQDEDIFQKNIAEESDTYSSNFEVKQIYSINKVYNLQRVVNDIITLIYENKGYEKSFPYKEAHIESLKKLGVASEQKRFYIEKAYEVDLSNNMSFYFLEGYLINNINNSEDSAKMEKVTLTIQRKYINDRDNYLLETYNSYSFKHIFEYDDDMSETKVRNISEEDLNMFLISDDMVFKSVSVNNDVSDIELAYWYYEDYKNRKVLKDQDIEFYINTVLFKYDGNEQDGFILIDNNENRIIVKPGNVPMEYNVEQ